MSGTKKLEIACPECRATLVIDTATGEVLFHKPARPVPGAGKDFDALLRGLDEGKARAEALFEREKAAMKDRSRLLEERFEEALKKAEEDDEEPPLRPFEFD